MQIGRVDIDSREHAQENQIKRLLCSYRNTHHITINSCGFNKLLIKWGIHSQNFNQVIIQRHFTKWIMCYKDEWLFTTICTEIKYFLTKMKYSFYHYGPAFQNTSFNYLAIHLMWNKLLRSLHWKIGASREMTTWQSSSTVQVSWLWRNESQNSKVFNIRMKSALNLGNFLWCETWSFTHNICSDTTFREFRHPKHINLHHINNHSQFYRIIMQIENALSIDHCSRFSKHR